MASYLCNVTATDHAKAIMTLQALIDRLHLACETDTLFFGVINGLVLLPDGCFHIPRV